MGSLPLMGAGPSGAGGSFSPDSVSGLELWLAADEITGLADTDPVATWPDLSGNGRDATQATGVSQPLYRTAQVNGLPAVKFDGSNDYLTVAYALANASGSDATHFLVLSGTVGTPLSTRSGGSKGWIIRHSIYAHIGGSPNISTGLGVSTWQLLTVERSGLSIATRVNAAASSSGTISSFGASAVAVTHLGGEDGTDDASSAPNTQFADHFVAELLSYSAALGTTDRDAVEAYLMDRYAL